MTLAHPFSDSGLRCDPGVPQVSVWQGPRGSAGKAKWPPVEEREYRQRKWQPRWGLRGPDELASGALYPRLPSREGVL